jgi:hypothetical protein
LHGLAQDPGLGQDQGQVDLLVQQVFQVVGQVLGCVLESLLGLILQQVLVVKVVQTTACQAKDQADQANEDGQLGSKTHLFFRLESGSNLCLATC